MEVLRLPPAYLLVTRETVDSTNDEAKRLARAGAEDGTLVWARSQTAGRGRGGRSWVSPPGNLYFSLVLRPACAPAQAAELAFVAALGVGNALGAVLPPLSEVRYKWPNDVLLNERKVAGILLETESAAGGELDWLVLGIGINIASHPEDAGFPATNLEFESGIKQDSAEVLAAFARHFLVWVNRWLDEGFAPVRAAWMAQAMGIGERIRVRLPTETLRGKFVDLEPDGRLVLDLGGKGGVRRISAGDVFFETA